MAGIRIAVIDDDADDREFIAMALNDSSKSVQVDTFSSGPRFLESLKAGLPHVVITDLRMPLMTGFDLISEVKSDERTRNVPVVVLSTSGNAEDKKRAASLGASAYYVKPYLFDGFADITKDILRNYSSGELKFVSVSEWCRLLLLRLKTGVRLIPRPVGGS